MFRVAGMKTSAITNREKGGKTKRDGKERTTKSSRNSCGQESINLDQDAEWRYQNRTVLSSNNVNLLWFRFKYDIIL